MPLSYSKGTLIRELWKDTRIRSIREGSHRSRNDSSTEWPTGWRHRELYRKASTREEHQPSPPSCQLSRCKPYLPRSTICGESGLEPVLHAHAYDVPLLGTLLCGQRMHQSIGTTKLISYSPTGAKWATACSRGLKRARDGLAK